MKLNEKNKGEGVSQDNPSNELEKMILLSISMGYILLKHHVTLRPFTVKTSS